MSLRIGELARRTRTTAPTIRYYEEIGLLPVPARRGGGQRCYGDDDRQRLAFIRQCRAFGFSIEQVRALVTLALDDKRPCTETRSIAFAHLRAVREKLAELEALERSLAGFVQRCDAMCAAGAAPDCVIIKDMEAMPAANDRRADTADARSRVPVYGQS